MDVIVACFLGDITKDELEVIRESFNIIEPGLVSIPKALPWPLSRTPLSKLRPFNYGRAMEARAAVSKTILGIVERRRKELSSADKWESKYVIDTVLEKQAQQWANGGPAEGEMLIDENFIIDNVSLPNILEAARGNRRAQQWMASVDKSPRNPCLTHRRG